MKNIKDMTITALMTALICVLGPFSLPIGPVPIALTNFVIFITLYVIGMKRGLIAVALYLLIGLIGLPVFSGFGAGIGKLVGPTGGYLIGYLPMALMAVMQHCRDDAFNCRSLYHRYRVACPYSGNYLYGGADGRRSAVCRRGLFENSPVRRHRSGAKRESR